MDQIKSDLEKSGVGKVKEFEPMSNHTTIKIGGPADLFVEPSSVANLEKTMEIVRKYNVPWRAIGRGSNLLVSDKGIEGIVIKLGRGLDKYHVDGTQVTAGGGHSLISLATSVSRLGLKGLEFAGGIPGSVGGAVYMNAGAHGSDMSRTVKKALILFEDGKMEWLSNAELAFSYRTSILQKQRPGIVLEALLELEEGRRDEIVKEVQKNKDYRKETQPWNYPCAGSIFRNPLPNYAGRLIEVAGLKGHSIGGAKISEMHGNFIVNTGNATALDVLGLIQHVQDTIYDLYEIKMVTEVEIIGRNPL